MSADPDTSHAFDDLVETILTGTGPHLRDLFAPEGAKAPKVKWAPAASDLTNPQTLDFARRLQAFATPHDPINQRDFRLEDFAGLLPWMLLLEVEDAGTTFRYSHYGDGIANVRGLSMLGRTSADFGGYIGLFFTAAYRAIVHRGQWLLTEHAAPKQVFARTWERLMVPIQDPAGNIARIAVLNVPDNELRAGLEIIPDPVMVLDSDQVVRYANPAARRMFDRTQFPSQDMTLFDYSGIDLDLAQTPGELVAKHAVHEKLCLATRNNILRDFLVTVSGARIWDTDYYVLTLRMDIRDPGGRRA